MPDHSADEAPPERPGERLSNADVRYRSEAILAVLERRDEPMMVGELAEVLARYDGREPRKADVGDVHQWLYRTELQRLNSDGELAFDANTGLVRPRGIDRGEGTSNGERASDSTDRRWSIAYAVVTVAAAGLFSLSVAGVDPLGGLPPNAVLGALVSLCAVIAAGQFRAQ